MIVDDEPLAAKLICSYVQQVPGLEIASVCNNAIEAFEILGRQKVDLMFLDIKMPKLIGTEFLRSLPNPPKVIFITAYRDYAFEGFELDIIDYLLKPVSFVRFMKAVAKTVKLISVDDSFSPAKSELGDDPDDSFLYFRIDREMRKVLLHEILYIESCREYVELHLENKKSLLVRQSISSVQKMLSPHRFIRVHRSYIAIIEKISSYSSTHITVNDCKIPIGRLYKNEVEKVLQR
ncbi:MAG TPA: LytTR family DNA-binding domain-containing protein [Mucilaginibacter sp.]|nr:LytTR family DNA-binding domain-containing protein [Mucilaginibacter sp.]